MYRTLFMVGITVSIIGMTIGILVINQQLKQFNHDNKLNYLKAILLMFGMISFASNIIPLIFDIYRIAHPIILNGLQMAYLINNYLYRILAVTLLFLVYRY